MKKIAIILIIVVFILLTSSYFILFSPITANNPSIIDIRKKYSDYVTNSRNIDSCSYLFQPIRILRSRTDNNITKYTYSLGGKLTDINDIGNYITLKCSNGNKYKLGIDIESTVDNDWVIIPQGRNINIDNPKKYPFMFNTKDLSQSIQKDQFYKEGAVYYFVWEDNRKLSEIYINMRKNKTNIVNNNGGIIVGLLR